MEEAPRAAAVMLIRALHHACCVCMAGNTPAPAPAKSCPLTECNQALDVHSHLRLGLGHNIVQQAHDPSTRMRPHTDAADSLLLHGGELPSMGFLLVIDHHTRLGPERAHAAFHPLWALLTTRHWPADSSCY
jgi:hypothetical protein